MTELLDPANLTPESLYELQSETWSQGYRFGQEEEYKRIMAILAKSVEFSKKMAGVAYPAKMEKVMAEIDEGITWKN